MAEFGNQPIVILTGGDPLMRRDTFDFIGYGLEKGLRVSLSPSATALIRPETLKWLKEAGLSRISFSLDGAKAQTHDTFRGVRGSFQRTLECAADAVEAGLSLQINTTVTRYSFPELAALVQVVRRSEAVLWDLFFLVPTGRALAEDMLSPQEHEQVFHWLAQLSHESSFGVRTTLGQPYRRVLLQQNPSNSQEPGKPAEKEMPTTNDGKGVCFISHVGQVQPSGFLPLSSGNVRTSRLTHIYRHTRIFKELRDPGLLKGKCGRCPFKEVCGGCRARAYAVSGDYLESDPCCAYEPRSSI
jgi:radical SAM protein with 4Fe4S-binding SPASM domain